MKKSKKIWIIIITTLLLIITIGSMICILNKKENEKVIGTVIESGNGYTIIEGEKEDYIIADSEYEIGSILEIEILKFEKNTTPITIQKSKIEVIKKPEEKESTMSGNLEITMDEELTSLINPDINQNTKDKVNVNNTNPEENTSSKEEPKIDNIEENTTSNDEMIMDYFQNTERSLNNNDGNKIKDAFVTTIDFLFYNGNIKGVKLNDITTKTKLFVLKYALKLDAWIDNKIPNYKESISENSNRLYSNVKNKIITTYLDTTAKICNNNKELCKDAKNDFQSMKTSFKITWNLIKTLANTSKSHLKEWYEIWSNK